MRIRYRIAEILIGLAERFSNDAVEDWFWDRVEYLSDEVWEYLRG